MLLLSLLFACGTEPTVVEPAPIEPAEVAAAAASTLCSAATQAGFACKAEGSSATLGERKLELSAVVASYITMAPSSFGRGEEAQQFPGEIQLGVELGLAVDGAPLLTVEQAHAASDPELAVARAKVLDELVQRWAVTHGSAVLDALGGDPASPVLASLGLKTQASPHGEIYAWAGFPVLRGRGFDPKTASKMGPSVQSMLDALGPFTEGLSADGLHTVQVESRLGGGGAPGPCGILPPVSMNPDVTTTIVPLSGQVLVDGVASGNICSLSEPVAWALPPAGSVLEWDQLFVVGVGTAAAPVEVPAE